MEFNQFVAIMEDIGKHAEKNSALDFWLNDGTPIKGAWEWLRKETTSHGVIVISREGDRPPIYMPVASVAYVEIPKR